MPRYGLLLLTGVALFCVEKSAPAETPAENVRKSQWYDHLLSIDASFRAYRMREECRPIVNDPPLLSDCLGSFEVYTPFTSGYRRHR
jgi:hypothetical protein